MKSMHNVRRHKRGAALVEYGLIVAGVALVAIVAISVFGTKAGGLLGATAAVLPGTQQGDNGAIGVGRIVKTEANADGTIVLTGESNDLGDNLGVDTADLVQDPGTGN